jgi:hypothetical protein
MCASKRSLVICLLVFATIDCALSANNEKSNLQSLTFERMDTVTDKPPTTKKWYMELPNKLRQESLDGSMIAITDAERGQILLLNREEKTATIIATQQSTKEHPVNLYADFFATETLDRCEANDKVIGDQQALAYEKSADSWSKQLWIDSTSRRPLRMTVSFAPKTKPATICEYEKFEYDPHLDESLFDVTAIPKGYSVVKPAAAQSGEFKAY